MHNSRSAGPAVILMPFLSLSDALLQGNHVIFQSNVAIFEIMHKLFSILVFRQGSFAPKHFNMLYFYHLIMVM